MVNGHDDDPQPLTGFQEHRMEAALDDAAGALQPRSPGRILIPSNFHEPPGT